MNSNEFVRRLEDINDTMTLISKIIIKLSQTSILSQINLDKNQSSNQIIEVIKELKDQLTFFSEDLSCGEFLSELIEENLLNIREMLKEDS